MDDEAKAKEWNRRKNLTGTTVRRMLDKRCNTYALSNRGTDYGSKTEILKRGKVTGTLYILPEIKE